ncbi:Tripartite-type tricarboxylate transporter [Commensalibacter communis]|uniref:Extracytoplasmic receptor component TctC (TctC) n=1 Tax=Commensalibacter communis TaxID=2972786 RepID=A0A9W4TPS0_9PROT|nr:hypothetical protein [Commensalibacter communis]CAI3922763.1 Tripartite-type tricarboxylate transporter [Commensalibacter communis]CAI3923181.1 Tripartite-type tricarboxylate transporter [Commensalibacter communis]CAI3945004.1 Tripartite-type tricarboxylate transporter [Commensalibacter communis]CAI3946424.1 Tripartite-type tricarboxylate transporter [Commensalibacter communis]CAI3947489.1 Tripartite-type tricarboxylate transporter [Commensalibacter communis]
MPLSVTKRQFFRILSLAGASLTTTALQANANEVMPMGALQTSKSNNSFSFIVGGSEKSDVGEWASQFSSVFTSSLQDNAPVPLRYTSGYDGITGANLFDTRIVPDGNTALLTSGNPFIASMSGDKRVHYDCERWIPILSSLSPSITIARQPFHNSIPDLLKNRSMKVAVSSIIGKELPTLLGIELLKITTIPVEGLTDFSTAVQALKKGDVDVIQLSTPEAFAALPSLLKDGLHTFFSLDNTTTFGPKFSDLYSQLPHYKTGNTLFEAWNALALASRMNVSIMLPMLTPSALVAKWRLNTSKLLKNEQIIDLAKKNNVIFQENAACIDTISKMCPQLITTMALQRWLNAKFTKWSNN